MCRRPEISQVSHYETDSDRQRTDISKDIYTDGTYLANNATWHVQDSPWKARQVAAMLSRNGLRPRTVAEIGCGAGEILNQLSAIMPGSIFSGYELSPQAFELCATRASANVRYFCEDLLQTQAFFDCLLCMDVFEHVRDYMSFLVGLKRKATYKIFHIPLDLSVLAVLRGRMMVERRNIGHLHYFTRETALATLQDCGYEIVSDTYTGSYVELPSSTFIGKCVKPIYRVLFSLSPHYTVRLFGLSSYLVLAK